jgi:hypothetical protein
MGVKVWQHYAQRGALPIELRRLRNHLVAYFRRGGNPIALERMVFGENTPLPQLLMWIEQQIGLTPRTGGTPGETVQPRSRVVCENCGQVAKSGEEKCTGCGSPLGLMG